MTSEHEVLYLSGAITHDPHYKEKFADAETVLMNLLRGSGLTGLTGIPEKRGRYIRPLLGVSRREIEAYAKAHGIEYVRDITNDDTDYTRNYVRKELLR